MDCTGIGDCAVTLFLNAGPGLAALLLLGTYLGLLAFARCTWIYRRNHMHLRAYADMVEAQLGVDPVQPESAGNADPAVKSRIMALLNQARGHLPDEGRAPCLKIAGVGRQLAAWRLVHDADRMATDLLPIKDIEAHALVVMANLKSSGSDPGKTLADKISKCLEGGPKDHLRELVKEGRGMVFEVRDGYYEDLSDWQNKATWLVIVTAIILFLVAVTLGNDKLLLLGAVGGLLARLRKTLSAKKVGFDYGVSWSVLFLAPLVGALTGWAGVLLAVVFMDPSVLHLTADQFAWATAANTEPGMVLAIVFGYSATLFDRVLAGAEAALTKTPEGGSSTT